MDFIFEKWRLSWGASVVSPVLDPPGAQSQRISEGVGFYFREGCGAPLYYETGLVPTMVGVEVFYVELFLLLQ